VSAPTPHAALSPPGLIGLPDERQRRRRAPWLVAVSVVLIGAVLAIAMADPFSSGAPSQSGLADNADPTGLYIVARQDLSSQTQVPATLGYAASYSIINRHQGTVTALPATGRVIGQGQILYEVNGSPVVLLFGSTPAYRTLSSGLTGADVAELNADLVALGDATTADIPAGSDTFTSATATALEKFQAALGLAQNGTLILGQAVFLPTAARITSVSATLGAPAQSGEPVLQATSITHQVIVAMDASQQSEVAVGARVTITLPNDATTPGVISSVGTVATTPSSNNSSSSGSANPTITVLVKPTDPAATGGWDQAPVNVTITTGTVNNALVVPVDALRAIAGGYAVEVVGADGVHNLVAVNLGLFDDADGMVEVTGTSLAAGERVVVPEL
jgi:hypothetical protein